MHRQAVLIRKNDGQIKQCEVRFQDGRYHRKSSKDGSFRPRKTIHDFADGTQSLIVCERDNADPQDVFTRKLPGPLSTTLFFGDLLIVYVDFRNILQNFLVEDMLRITDGSHPLWCVQGCIDVGETLEENDAEDFDEEDFEDESSLEEDEEEEDDEEDSLDDEEYNSEDD